MKVTDGGAEEWEDVESDEDVSARSKSFDAVCNLVLEGEGSGGGAEGLRDSVQRGIDVLGGCVFEDSARAAGEALLLKLKQAQEAGGLSESAKKKRANRKRR